MPPLSSSISAHHCPSSYVVVVEPTRIGVDLLVVLLDWVSFLLDLVCGVSPGPIFTPNFLQLLRLHPSSFSNPEPSVIKTFPPLLQHALQVAFPSSGVVVLESSANGFNIIIRLAESASIDGFPILFRPTLCWVPPSSFYAPMVPLGTLTADLLDGMLCVLLLSY